MENDKKSGKEQLVIDILDSWIGKLGSLIVGIIGEAYEKVIESRKVKQ